MFTRNKSFQAHIRVLTLGQNAIFHYYYCTAFYLIANRRTQNWLNLYCYSKKKRQKTQFLESLHTRRTTCSQNYILTFIHLSSIRRAYTLHKWRKSWAGFSWRESLLINKHFYTFLGFCTFFHHVTITKWVCCGSWHSCTFWAYVSSDMIRMIPKWALFYPKKVHLRHSTCEAIQGDHQELHIHMAVFTNSEIQR